MFDFLNVFDNREIDVWRDDYTLLAAATLNQAAADVLDVLEPQLSSTTLKDGLFGQSGFIAGRVAPQVRSAIDPIAQRLVEEANRALARIVEHQAVWHRQPGAAVSGESSFEGFQDIAIGAGPLAGGLAIAAAIPHVAVTATGGLFGTGLFATTVISWPIVVGGGAIAGVAIATGAFNSARIRGKAEARLRRKIRDYVTTALLRGTPHQPSVLDQLTALFAKTAKEAKKL